MTRSRAVGVVVSCVFVACSTPERAVDPDGREHEARLAVAPLPAVALSEVVGAVGGVPERNAAATLERWLRATRDGERLLGDWPRSDGALDLRRAPVALSAIDASIDPQSRSRCGEVTVTFSGRGPVALRMRLPIPATAPPCRGRIRAARVTGAAAAPLLHAALADARVPDLEATSSLP